TARTSRLWASALDAANEESPLSFVQVVDSVDNDVLYGWLAGAASFNLQPREEHSFTCMLHIVLTHPGQLTEVLTHPQLVGDHPRILRIALLLTTAGATPRLVDRHRGHMQHGEFRLQQHRLQQRGDTTEQIEPDLRRTVLLLRRPDLLDQFRD